MSQTSTFNASEVQRVREIAESGRDEPVLMLNLNLYSADADFPNGDLYQRYMSALAKLLPEVGAEVLWRHNVSGQIAGHQKVHEILALWYPSHRAFIELRNAPSAAENFELRALAVEHGVIHRLSGFVHPSK
jgi:uncharacterized protein (DUF1330 family)